ncbi:MAG: CBS domain-containing protein, partial [Planctomycetota bacterium]|nr:CBS domain-containing protein [Planctomycetota bacterium]
VVVSHLVASALSADSIYSIKLRRLGGLTAPKSELSVLDMILVADAMNPPEHAVSSDTPLTEIVGHFQDGLARSFPVLDEDDRLAGFVHERDIEAAMIEGRFDDQTASDAMTHHPVTCTPGQSLGNVLHELTAEAVAEIPVVDRDDPQKLLGILGRREIFWAYGKMAGEHKRLLARTNSQLPTDHKDSVQMEIQVRADHTKLAYKKVRDVNMPDQCLIVVLRRAERAIVPRGDTVIEPGDLLVALTTRAQERKLREWAGKLNGDS